MRTIQTEILVIGGGATGAGIVRDLALRGFKTILVERRDLTDGTSGRYHGLLHSGGRYAVKDPHAARECIEENRILRKIMPQCIEDTGGFFVQVPGDDPEYALKFEAACRQSGIPCEEVPIRQMLALEPLLNPQITRCFRVPDGAADSFLAARLNAEDARLHGGEILRYHEVIRLIGDKGKGIGGRIVGALCHDEIHDEDVEITADLVINAAGAWAGKIAATAGIIVQMIPGKGTMLAVNHRIVHTVINRLKMPGDGDILVPAHTVAVIGTTDIKVPDPDRFEIEPWEVQLMLTEGEKLIPGFKDFRILRAWAGVRPLYQETTTAQNRDVTRAFVLLDHELRDGVAGLLTITGGKWTTYRKMGEVTVDKACEKLGASRLCRTHLEELPHQRSAIKNQQFLGHRLAHVEHDHTYGELICECELATVEDVRRAIVEGNATSLDDIRRSVRLGMGPCQAGFCALRAAGMLAEIRPDAPQAATALGDFLQERWKGLTPILWGEQLRQERLNELIYLDVLNVDHVGSETTQRDEKSRNFDVLSSEAAQNIKISEFSPVIVIGGGLAGLISAWRAAAAGHKVKLITKGWGATHWASGCIDILGYTQNNEPIASPRQALEALRQAQPRHPYSLAGIAALELAIRNLQALCAEAGYPLCGDLNSNWWLPTAVGALRPACLAPATMIAGDGRETTPMLIVGFKQFLDFWPDLIAANLAAQGIPAQAVTLDLAVLQTPHFVNSLGLARLFDTPEFCATVTAALKPQLGAAQRVGFPAVLGLCDSLGALQRLQTALGLPVFEIAGLPPSIPGMRLHNLLVEAIQNAGGQVFNGMDVIGLSADGQQVFSEAAARTVTHPAKQIILATGGILGGGIVTTSDGQVGEAALGLALSPTEPRRRWFEDRFLSPEGHAIFRAGIAVNAQFQPVDSQGQIIHSHLFAAGGILGGCDPIRERSLEGVALASAYGISLS